MLKDAETLRALCALDGASGREDAVREFVRERLPADVAVTVDALGNLIAEKRGRARAAKKVALFAHMDEVALLVTHITDDGFLRFAPVGGIEAAALFGKAVRLESGKAGVIGGKAVHHLEKAARETLPKTDALCIDVGARTRGEAETAARLGDNAYFDSEFTSFGDGFLKAKALDDRVGVWMLLSLLQKELPFDLTACFTVQEEIGTRGAAAAAFAVQPDFALVLECTTAADLADVPADRQVCALGRGPVVTFMDRGTVYDRGLVRLAFARAKALGLPCQTKTRVAGGNDAAAVHKAGRGVRTLAVSVPCRYLHSPACVIRESDVVHTQALIEDLAEQLCHAAAL